jgi:hypothetical protein
MLYGYQLTEEFPTSAVTHQLSVSATHGDTAATSTRKGPQLITLTGAVSPQSAHNTHNNRGRVISAASAAAYSMVKSASAHIYHQSGSTGSAESSSSSQRILRATTPPNLSVAAPSFAAQFNSVPYHAVVAASHSARFASLLKLVAPAGYNVASAEVIGFGRGLSQAIPSVAGTQSIVLVRTVGVLRGIISSQTIAILRSLVRHFSAASSQATSAIRNRGKVVQTTDGESSKLSRQTGKAFSIGSAEALGSPLGARTLHQVYGVATTGTLAVLRAISSHFHASQAPGPSLLRGSGKLFHATSAESAALQRTDGKVLSASDANAASTRRSAGLPRSVAATSIAAMISGTLRILSSRSAVDAQSASLLTPIIRAKSLPTSDANAGHLSTHVTKILPEVIALAQGQVAALARQMSTIRSLASANAAAAIKSIGLVRSIFSAEVLGLFVSAVRPRPLNSNSPQSTELIRSRVKILIAADGNTAFVQRSRGHSASVAQGNASILARLIAKIISIYSPQSVSIGKGTAREFTTSNAQAFTTSTPHGRILGAAQGQSSSTTPWYHLFVAPWAYQQTVLLPPAGGLAEPPYFAPIDPSDQTTFAFNWAARAAPGDAIVSATVTSVPAGFTFFGPVFINGYLVEVTALPFTPLSLPTTYSLRCTATFASGSRSSFSIPVRVQSL